MTLLAVLRGGAAKEAEIHARLRDHRVMGEWFSPHDEVLAEVALGERLVQVVPQGPPAPAPQRTVEAVGHMLIAPPTDDSPRSRRNYVAVKRRAMREAFSQA